MEKIILVENVERYVSELRGILAELGERREIVHLGSVEELQSKFADDAAFDQITLALVDLELGPAAGKAPDDLYGRDKVLPWIRARARWIPQILVSRYLQGASETLPQVSAWGFDALSSKDFFSSPSVYKRDWKDLVETAQFSRLAALTGRDVHSVRALEKCTLQVEYTAAAGPIAERVGIAALEQILRLMGLQTDRIIIDSLVPGFSGFAVFKVIVDTPGCARYWLLKIGSPIYKLEREIAAHRSMFVNGMLHRVTVPPLWWSPVTDGSIGAIAYEFEEDGETLLAVMGRDGFDKALARATPALAKLYREKVKQVHGVSNVLDRFFSALRDPSKSLPLSNLAKEFVTRSAGYGLSNTLQVTTGSMHGDLNCRNVLLSREGPVIIDFAHFRPANKNGVPAADLSQLLVDAWCAGALTGPLSRLLDGTICSDPGVIPLVKAVSLNDAHFSSDEMYLFRILVCMHLEQYTHYDIDADRRSQIEGILRGLSIERDV